MAWWVWALIVWATVASAVSVWMGARYAVYLQWREVQAGQRSDLWSSELLDLEDAAPVDQAVPVPTPRSRIPLPGMATLYRRTPQG